MFPDQTYCMLQDVEKQGLTPIVSWVGPDGYFRVSDRDRFENLVLPHYFGTAKFKSFRRQLNLYKFKCVRHNRQGMKGCYFHPCFHRDRPPNSEDFVKKPQISRCPPQPIKKPSESAICANRMSLDDYQQTTNLDCSKRANVRMDGAMRCDSGGDYADLARVTEEESNLSQHNPGLTLIDDPTTFLCLNEPTNSGEATPSPGSMAREDNPIVTEWVCQVPENIQADFARVTEEESDLSQHSPGLTLIDDQTTFLCRHEPTPNGEAIPSPGSMAREDNLIFTEWVCQVPKDIQAEIVATFVCG